MQRFASSRRELTAKMAQLVTLSLLWPSRRRPQLRTAAPRFSQRSARPPSPARRPAAAAPSAPTASTATFCAAQRWQHSASSPPSASTSRASASAAAATTTTTLSSRRSGPVAPSPNCARRRHAGALPHAVHRLARRRRRQRARAPPPAPAAPLHRLNPRRSRRARPRVPYHRGGRRQRRALARAGAQRLRRGEHRQIRAPRPGVEAARPQGGAAAGADGALRGQCHRVKVGIEDVDLGALRAVGGAGDARPRRRRQASPCSPPPTRCARRCTAEPRPLAIVLGARHHRCDVAVRLAARLARRRRAARIDGALTRLSSRGVNADDASARADAGRRGKDVLDLGRVRLPAVSRVPKRAAGAVRGRVGLARECAGGGDARLTLN